MPSLPPVKNTAGEGFTVEDAVVAWLSCHLLTGIPWHGAGGGIIRAIECQMRQDGWFFDDVVLRSEKEGVELRCACSIKSHAVFTKSGAPREFARALWRQWFNVSSSGFQRGRDSLVLVAAQHEPEVREAWFGLTETARLISPETLASRCESETEPSPLRRAAFKSLRIDDELGDPVETARLLQKFHLVEHDFQHSESQSVTHAVSICQQALNDAQRERASELWEVLLNFAVSVRRKGGCITLPDLLAKLAHRFSLKQHPNYAADWAAILTDSHQCMEALPTKIGGLVSVERRDLLELVRREAERHQTVAILGESGNGKSVIAHKWATADARGTVWLRAGDLSTRGGLRTLFRLTHGLADLFANSCQPFRLVLDGLDKTFDEAAFDEAALILRAASSAESKDRCRAVLTCCPEDWARVCGQLIRRGIAITGQGVRVERFTDPELREACEQLPSLQSLAQRQHLYPILRWPKALDIVATFWRASDAPLPWVTESDFARWFWRSAICREHPASFRDRIARKLAVQLADRMAATAQLDDFARDEAETLAEMAREGHIEIDSVKRTVRFAHELTADWARQRELQVQGEAISSFLQTRLQSPLWHRAVRFHGLDLLERQPDSAAWQRLFLAFNGASTVDEIAQNRLLEAPIFAIGQRAVLDHLWPVLQLDEGKLLRRFLRQFLHAATIPNEEMVAYLRSRSPDLQLEAVALYRLPWAPYWLGVLTFLAAHAEETTALALEEVADVCLLWLPLHSPISSGMKDAAYLTVVAAGQLYRDGERWHREHNRVSAEEKICQALLAAAPVMPAEVAALALKLSGRAPADAEDGVAVKENEHCSPLIPDLGPLVPWPEGPQRPCAQFFSDAFMNGGYAAPFFHALPEVAVEVMFAVLLNIPHANWHLRDFHPPLDEHGFNASELKSCFWTSGPFLAFLRINPTIALPAIIRLVNFATDRAYELGEHLRAHIEVPVTVDGKTRIWRGHQFSYLWNEGHVFGPRAVGCALLSLEKWFYLLMDNEEHLTEHIGTILRESRSIALAAVLICVGKREPELFLGPLRPMLEAVDFYWIEESMRHEGGFRAAAFYERSNTIRDAWREWVQLPHRKETLGKLALRMFLGHPRWREVIVEFRSTWQTRLDAATLENPAPRWLPNIVSQFDPANWQAERRGEEMIITYEAAANLPQPTPEEAERLKSIELLTLLPFQCSQVLSGAAECSERQMSEWWSRLSAVRTLQVPSAEFEFWQVEDALCGIVAVAVVHHCRWLAADPARQAEAFAILRDVGAKPPKRFWFSEDDICDFKWDNFVAWALTTLWCEQPNDPFLLQSVGMLALWDRYLVVARVMSIAAKHRAQLGAHFDALLSHTVRYSTARHRARMEEHLPEKKFDRDSWVRAHLEKFLVGQTEPLPASWVELAEPQNRSGMEANNLIRGFDIAHICAALNWAEDLSNARDAAERLKWVGFHRQTLICALTRLEWMSPSKSRVSWNDQQNRWPYEDERRLLQHIARLVARLAPGEDHRPLWESVFALGCAGAQWVEAFVSHWLLEATDNDDLRPVFIEQWLAMLSYAECSPAWKRGGENPSSSREMWRELLGLSSLMADIWNDEKLTPAIEAAREFHERWARAHVRNHDDARTYIHFLKTRAARTLRIPGLCLLHERVPAGVGDRYFWKDSSTCNAFASLLRLLLDEHWQELVANPAARNGFMSFALKLSALQHPLGSEVLAVVGNRFGGMT